MALAGPQIGGVSLLFHASVLIFLGIKSVVSPIAIGVKRFFQKNLRPFLPNAK